VPSYSDEELAFARELQQNFGVEPAGMTTATQPLPPDGTTMGASTDVADVSWITPTMGCGMPTMPLGVSVHTWAATASHGTSIGKKGAIYAMRALALLGADLVTDADLRQSARADFAQRTNDTRYTSPLPLDMKRPLALEEAVTR
jgi:aminobenzoyl-glutamate utilization protein B